MAVTALERPVVGGGWVEWDPSGEGEDILIYWLFNSGILEMAYEIIPI